MRDPNGNDGRPSRDEVPAALPAQLRALADRVADLEAARVIGELEALKFSVWTAVRPPPWPTVTPLPPLESGALSQDEAAETYRIPLRTLRRLTRTGRVPSYLLGRNRMIRPRTSTATWPAAASRAYGSATALTGAIFLTDSQRA